MISKNQILAFLALAIFVFGFSSCDSEESCIKGSGDSLAQEFTVGAFTAIELEAVANVQIIQGAEQKVAASGQQNILDDLVLTVDNGILTIGLLEDCYDYSNLLFNITIPTISALKIDGSGAIASFSPLVVDDIELAIKGSGSFSMALEATNVVIDLEGSGSFNLGGSTQAFSAKMDGSGRIQAFDLTADDVTVNLKGSANAEVTANELLEVTIDGSGRVLYKGSPMINQNIMGSGAVVDAN